MTGKTKATEGSVVLPAAVAQNPILLARGGRGKSGGSFLLTHAIQRARFHGRRVKPLDADKRSETLIRLYGPPEHFDGPPNPEWATAPASEEPADVRDWLLDDLDKMAEDGISRVVDFNGGDRVISEVQRDLDLGAFCEAIGVQLMSLITLGPDVEDFRHMVKAARAGHLKPHQALLALNEGVIAQGQTTTGAFDRIFAEPDLKALVKDGARIVMVRRLPCVSRLRDAGLGFYEAAYPTPDGPRPTATLTHMTRQWIEDYEGKLVKEGATGSLP